jgi:hypothetical protein
MKNSKELEIYRAVVSKFESTIEQALFPNPKSYGDNPYREIVYELEDLIPSGEHRNIARSVAEKYMNAILGAVREMKI